MMINPAKIYSTLGNPNSLIPLGVKDISSCVGMTAGSYATGKEEGFDRFIDEFGTEGLWLGGIPTLKWIYDKTVFKAFGLDAKIDPRNLKDMDMFEKVKKILAEQLDVSEDRITMDANIVEDLEADSLSVMQVIMELEEEFNISVDDSDLNNLHTVGDIVRFVEAKTK